MKRLFITLSLIVAFIVPSHAVLKERDLDNTLSILRQELTDHYQDLLNQAREGRQFSSYVFSELMSVMQRSNQISLMLYSQKPGYVFDLTYACHEATEMYQHFQRNVLPFRNMIQQIDIEKARYDSLVVTLNQMPVARLSEQAKTDRNVCLTLAVNINRTLGENRQQMSDYITIYERTEQRLKSMNDYANLRYNDIQNSIFVNGGDNYFKILSHLPLNLEQTSETVIEKYRVPRKVRSDWDSKLVFGLFLMILFYAMVAVVINVALIRYLLPKRFRSDWFMAKRTCIIMATTVITFAIILGILRLVVKQNFFLMASGLLVEYAWLLGVILVSLLLRVGGGQIKSAFRIYSPLIFIGFVVIAFRIILVPNDLVNLIFPPILLVSTFWQWSVIGRHNDNIPRSDVFYTYVSLLVFASSVVCSWLGYTLLSVQMLIWWIMQLTCILTITCVRQWIKAWGRRHGFDAQPITRTWLYRLLCDVLLPVMGVWSIMISIYWAADVFNLTELTWRIFTYKFVNTETFTLSLLNIAIVVSLWFFFNYVNQTAKELLRHYFVLKDPSTADSRIVMARNVLQVIVWGVWLLLSLAICHVSNTWLVVVSGGLSTGVGFASKDILENIYYGISLMAGRIKVGDWIICDGVRGRVSSISYTSTMLETVDGSVMAFQNSQLFTKNYKNLTRNHGYELHFIDVGVAYGTDIERVKRLLAEAISKLPFVDHEKGVRIVLKEFGDSSVNLKVLVWLPVLTQYVNDGQVLECIYTTLNDNNIEIPFPQRDLHIIQQPTA